MPLVRHAGRIEYRPRQPTELALHGIVLRQWPTLVARHAARDGAPPRFIDREFTKFIECGVPALGFVRVRCPACGHDRAVPFSCKGRGFCPSCGGRRMAETAARLVTTSCRTCRSASGCSRCHVRCATGSPTTRASPRRCSPSSCAPSSHGSAVASGQPGAVTFIQRFGSSINLNLHFHSLVLDGVYIERDGKAQFRPLPAPLDRDVEALCKTIARRASRLLARRGLSDDAPDPLAEEEPLLAEVCAASIQNVVARIGDEVDIEETHRGPLCADVSGFSLQAAVVVPANDRNRLERLVRYVARPPIAAERLSILSDGRIAYEMKRRWRDGTTHVIFQPDQLVERLVALIPAPQKNLVRYHGVLAPRARLRPQVVAQARRPTEDLPAPEGLGLNNGFHPPPPTKPGRYMSWADLLKRVWEIDVLSCPRCAGRMKIVATLTDPNVVAAFLRSLGVSTEVPRFVPARSPPLADDVFCE